jgi:FkbM family methyltransferase
VSRAAVAAPLAGRLRARLVRLLPDRALFLARRLLALTRTREPELALVSLLARPDRGFLDVGAHKGVYLQEGVGADWRAVIGIEPHPGLAAYLRRCFGDRAGIRSLALSDRKGSLPLYLPRAEGREMVARASLDAAANQGFAQEAVTVPVDRLDDLDGLPPLGLIKIDVEGHEEAALRGGEALLRRDRPVLLVEIEERHHAGSSDRIIAWLEGLGYETFYLDRPRHLAALAGRSVAALQASTGWTARPGQTKPDDYVNNFVFVHREDAHARERLSEAGYL